MRSKQVKLKKLQGVKMGGVVGHMGEQASGWEEFGPRQSSIRSGEHDMASEKAILRALDLMTVAAPAQLETLAAVAPSAPTRVNELRNVLDSENVVAVGISEKESDGEATGQLALTFYVEKKLPLSQLRADAAVPPTIPTALSGSQAIPTDVVPIGRLRPEAAPLVGRKPVQPGFSIGHIAVTAGTLGALVSNKGKLLILSNCHVMADSGNAQKGDHILYPGPQDNGMEPDDIVAELEDFVEFVTGGDFVNRVDCAVAKPLDGRLADLTSEIKGLGVPSGTVLPKRGMQITKVGRTTGKTRGRVRDVNFRFVLDYPALGPVGFVDQALCTRCTDGGDSGSLVLDAATGKAVGLHFAGASGGSVFNPIREVLKALQVRLVTRAIP
jgi:hypothetical protein